MPKRNSDGGRWERGPRPTAAWRSLPAATAESIRGSDEASGIVDLTVWMINSKVCGTDDDALQEVVLAVLRLMRNSKGQRFLASVRDVPAVLATIAWRAKTVARKANSVADIELDQIPSDLRPADESLVFAEATEVAVREIRRLPTVEQSAFLLRRDGLTYRDVATRLNDGVPPTAAQIQASTVAGARAEAKIEAVLRGLMQG